MLSTWPVAAALVVAVAFTCIARLYNIMIYGHMATAGCPPLYQGGPNGYRCLYNTDTIIYILYNNTIFDNI